MSKLDWDTFVNDCARAFAEGASERDFGASVVGREVEWEGVVKRADGPGKQVKGFYVAMKCVTVPLRDGWTFVGDGLFLKTRTNQLVSETSLGSRILFSGRFPSQTLLAVVGFTPDDEQRKVFLRLALIEGSVLSHQRPSQSQHSV